MTELDASTESVDELRRQRDEVLDTLRAIRSGEADALIIDTASGEEVFTLRGADRPYRLLVEDMTEGACTISPEGTILYSNTRFGEIVGVSCDKLVGSAVARFIGEESRAQFDDVIESDDVHDPAIRLTLVAADGRLVPTRATVGRIDLDGQNASYLLVTDVTNEERATAAMVFEAQVLDTAGEAIIATRPDGEIRYVNASAERLFIRRHGEMVGLSIEDVILAEEFGDQQARITEQLREGQDWSGELVVAPVDDNPFWARVTATPVLNQELSLSAIIFTSTDITDRKNAEIGLVGRERWFRTLVGNSSDLILVVDAQGALRYANPTAERLVGFHHDVRRGRSLLEVVHPDDRDATVAAFLGAAGGDGPVRPVILRVNTAAGEWRVLEAIPTNCLDDPDIAGIVVNARDVTERQAAERRYRLLAENASDVVALGNTDGVLEWVSESVDGLVGWRPEQMVGHAFTEFVHPDDLPTVVATRKRLGTGSRTTFETRLRTAEGGFRWLSISVRSHLDDEGAPVAHVGSWRDVQDEVEARQALAKSERQLRLIMESAPVGMAVVDVDRHFLDVNPALCRMLDRDAAWLLAHGEADIMDPVDGDRDTAMREDVLAGRADSASNEEQLIRADGTRFWVHHSVGLLSYPGGPVSYVSQFMDITETRQAREELLTLATHDSLTGLVNRGGLLDEISRALRAGRRSGRSTAVLMVDLDHFKYINDSFGHAVGDEVIRAGAARIESSMRGGDLVARPGGDEFVIVMRDLEDPTDAVRAAWRLVQAFRQPMSTVEGEMYATASIGVGVATDSSAPDDLVREADTAMYVAKAEGRDRVSLFNEDLRAVVTSRLLIEAQLRPASERGELALWYQPEIDLSTGQVIAAEALLRWHHPDGEVWTADRFIDVAEDTGMILDIGDWVLGDTCNQAAAWSDRDRPLTVRVNLSALQVAEAGLLDALDQALESSGLDPSLLCAELTETALLRATSNVRSNLAGLRHRGIRIAIDDFGTGYASLAYLRDYPIDVIKIDRSFITNITTDDFDRQLVAGVVSLAQRLDMTVTAEGVEHDDQADILRELGCNGAQGYLYSKAVPPDDIDALRDRTYPHP